MSCLNNIREREKVGERVCGGERVVRERKRPKTWPSL